MSGTSVETVVEKHQLPGNGQAQVFAVGRNVVLNAAADEGRRERDSDKANSQVLCEYKWDPKTVYAGRILSARDSLLAYRLFNEQTGEAIRVLERESRARHLIKDFRHPIVDLQFAQHAPLLAVLDKTANLYVYHVNENGSELTKYLNIVRADGVDATNARLAWCPFVDTEARQSHVLAVQHDQTADIFFLDTIKEDLQLMEVRFEQLDDFPRGLIQIHTNAPIAAVRISPDATACAVTTTSGEFIFYIIENYQGRVVHSLHPLKNLHVNDMLFLDDLGRPNMQEGPFWRYVVLVSDSGRRLGIYSCYNWECVGKLRFESTIPTSKLDAMIDPSARYIYLADYESSNLFCLEVAPAFPGVQPFFVACSQISFHQNLLCVSPCSLEENTGNDSDDLLIDDDSAKPNGVTVTFAAITNRALIDLKVEVEKCLDIGLNEDPERGGELVQEKLAHQSKQLMLSSQRINSVASTDLDSSRRSLHMPDEAQPSPRTHVPSADPDPGTQQELKRIRQLLQSVSERDAALEKRLNEMNIQLEKVHKDNADLRREQTDNLADVLEKISNEMRNRDEHIEHTVKRMNTDLRADVKRIVEQTLNDNAVSLQSTMEVSNTRVVETIKTVMGQVLVPALDQLCNQLFLQLNEKFREGLQEFIEQVRQQQSQTVTPVLPDYSTITHMVEQHRYAQAFEYVLHRQDTVGLVFLCNSVNPDQLFNDHKNVLPAHVVLGLLQTLGQRFELDTDLKFNYLETIVASASMRSLCHLDAFKTTVDQVAAELNEFIEQEEHFKYKRQGRMISQLLVYARGSRSSR